MKNVIVILMTFSLLGCALKTSSYYYVSLESIEEAKIVSKRKLQLEKLSKNSEIPIEYLIVREEYSLRLSIGDVSYFPHLTIAVESTNNNHFTLDPRRDTSIVSEKGVICSSYYLDKNNRSIIHFGWSPGCAREDINREVSFDVVDSVGDTVASENIPFVLIRDGQYTLLDAI